MSGCMVTGGLGALVLLTLGIAVPLAGATDFNGMPRVFGALLVVGVWLIGVAAAVGARQWFWLASILVLGPVPLILYGTSISNDFSFPDPWDAFAREPWYLIALMLTPVPLLAYGVVRTRDEW